MKVVEIVFKSSEDSEVVEGTMVLESKVGDEWKEVDSWDVTSGTPEATRQFLLEDNMRVIVEGVSDLVPTLDKEQNAVVMRPRDPALKAALAKAEAERVEAQKKEDAAAMQAASQTVPPGPSIPRPAPTSGITPTSGG